MSYHKEQLERLKNSEYYKTKAIAKDNDLTLHKGSERIIRKELNYEIQ